MPAMNPASHVLFCFSHILESTLCGTCLNTSLTTGPNAGLNAGLNTGRSTRPNTCLNTSRYACLCDVTMSDHRSKHMPRHIPSHMPEHMPNHVPENMLGHMSDHMSRHISQREPRYAVGYRPNARLCAMATQMRKSHAGTSAKVFGQEHVFRSHGGVGRQRPRWIRAQHLEPACLVWLQQARTLINIWAVTI